MPKLLKCLAQVATALMLISPALAFAESLDPVVAPERQSAVTFEAVGRGLLYSIDYDREVSENFSIGLGYSSFSAGIVGITVIPLYVDYYFYHSDLRTHRWFATAGLDIVTATANFWGLQVGGTGALPTVGAGYEYRSQNGFIARAALYVVAGDSAAVLPGVSIGYSF